MCYFQQLPAHLLESRCKQVDQSYLMLTCISRVRVRLWLLSAHTHSFLCNYQHYDLTVWTHTLALEGP